MKKQPKHYTLETYLHCKSKQEKLVFKNILKDQFIIMIQRNTKSEIKRNSKKLNT